MTLDGTAQGVPYGSTEHETTEAVVETHNRRVGVRSLINTVVAVTRCCRYDPKMIAEVGSPGA